MSHTIVMPRFGATMEEGTINSWSVKEGQAVSTGDVLGEIAIEKLTNELLAEEDGVVLKLLAEEGDTLPCGSPILILGAVGESLEAPVPEAPVHAMETATATPAPAAAGGNGAEARPAPAAEYHASAQITPKALQLAQELGVDYHYITGSGRFGMITREDIRSVVDAGLAPVAAAPVTAAQQAGAPVTEAPALTGETHKMTPMQTAIARAMEASLKSSAQTTISMDMEAGAMVKAYRAHKEEYSQQGLKLTYTAILVKIVAAALVEHKLLRTVIEENNLVTRGEINIGIAIDVADGLVVPNIKNAQQKSLRQVAAELADLGERARNNSLTLEQVSGGVFTITNLGTLGIKYFTPVLNPGESGILGVGTLQEVPYIQAGGIFVKPVINLSLTHDHRVVNGAPAARFLQAIQRLMNECEGTFKD